MNKQNLNRKKKGTYRLLALLFGVIFLCCVVWMAAYLIGQRRAESDLEEIKESFISTVEWESSAEEERSDSTGSETGTESEAMTSEEIEEESQAEAENEKRSLYGVSDKVIDIAGLQKEVNADIYAWITVPGTVIDYPVLQHPEEMDYYLDYNLDGSKGYPGCIYTQRMNSKDWTDPNTVLYGHNMKAGTMFAGLHKFKDKDFFDENRYIHIYTEDGRILVYEIFAAYVSGNEHLLMNYMLQTEDGFQSYLDGICEHTGSGCHFLEDRELTAEDRIITLSTCISGQETKRYLVQGVFIDEIEINN